MRPQQTNTTYHYRIGAVDSDGDEGLLAFKEHGRIGPDSTSIYLQDATLNHTTGPDLDEGTDFTLEAFVRFPSFPGGMLILLAVLAGMF
jgi:hypothetical protein